MEIISETTNLPLSSCQINLKKKRMFLGLFLGLLPMSVMSVMSAVFEKARRQNCKEIKIKRSPPKALVRK
jgi:hypothetical protein